MALPDEILELKQTNWPSVDCRAWTTLFAAGDILDGQGPLAHWRPVTRQKCAQSYGYWLAYLMREGQLYGDSNPAKRVTPEVIPAYIDATLNRCSVETTHMRIAELKKIVIAMSPETDWEWLKKIEDRLRRRCHHGQIKQRAEVTARELYDWGLNWMAKAEADKNLSARDCAVQYRQGLVVALLIARPIRQRAFLSLQIGKSVLENGGQYALVLEADDTKDGKAREYPLPDGLNAAMDRYIAHHRKVLLAGAHSAALWITKYGREFTKIGFSTCLAKLTRREFSETLRSHAFRHIAATSIALDDSEHVNIIVSILGHSSLATSEKYYNRAQGIEATHAYQGVVRDLRKSSAPRKPSRGAKRPQISQESAR